MGGALPPTRGLNYAPATSPHEVMSSDNHVTAAETALAPSDPVVSKCPGANLSPPSEAVPSQAKSDPCNSVDHVNVYASFNTDVKNNKSEAVSLDISLNDELNPPDAVLLKYSDAELT